MVPVKTNRWLPSILTIPLTMNGWQSKRYGSAINVIENEKDYKVELAAPE